MKKHMYIVYIYYIYNKFIIIILYIILIVILVVIIQSPSLHSTSPDDNPPRGRCAKIIVSIVSIVPTPSLFTRPGSRKISKAFAQEFEAPLANTLFSPSENRSQSGRNR